MIVLEKLYDSAGENLSGETQNWSMFANEFLRIFNAGLVLYRPSTLDGVLAWRSMDQLVATTHPEHAEGYVKNRIFDSNQIPDDSLNPLEPNRRSDIIPDSQFRQTEIARNFFIPRGIFYMLAVSAILPDDTYLMMVVWRSEEHDNFSDIEKQRLALFMRYLATLIRTNKPEFKLRPDSAVEQFGEKFALTSSEVEVLTALLQGKTLKFIAEKTGRSYGTVRWHVQNILEKCQVKSQKNLLSEFYALIKK